MKHAYRASTTNRVAKPRRKKPGYSMEDALPSLQIYLQELMCLVERMDRVQDNLIMKLLEHDECFDKITRVVATQADIDLLLHRQERLICLAEGLQQTSERHEKRMAQVDLFFRQSQRKHGATK